jgi:hypothetical protein
MLRFLATIAVMLACPEPTYEGMCRLLAAEQPSIGILQLRAANSVGTACLTRGLLDPVRCCGGTYSAA